MVEENPTWGAPRIHGELLNLDLKSPNVTSLDTSSALSPPDQTCKLWATFLRNHHELVTAMDFTVPTLTFRVLYCFFVIEHPTSSWVVQQLREAFPDCSPYR